MQKLTLADIKDTRAYERERAEFRSRIIAMKKRRRIHLGELLTVTFENTDSMRFQIQEMARVERMVSDEQIEHEIATYNQLIPEPGELSGTLFIEIDDKPMLYEWLPKLVGIQRALSFRVGDAGEAPADPLDHLDLLHDELGNAVAPVHLVPRRRVGVHEHDLDLAPIERVDETGCVEAGDAVTQREPGPGQHEAGVARRDRHRDASRHECAATPGLDDDVLARVQVVTGVVRVLRLG